MLYIWPTCYPAVSGGESVISLCLGRHLVSLLQVVKRTNTPLFPQHRFVDDASTTDAIPLFTLVVKQSGGKVSCVVICSMTQTCWISPNLTDYSYFNYLRCRAEATILIRVLRCLLRAECAVLFCSVLVVGCRRHAVAACSSSNSRAVCG